MTVLSQEIQERFGAQLFPQEKPYMKRFHFQRDEDASGVSGVGRVAEGVQFESGDCVVSWLVEPHTMGVYRSLENVVLVHGHNGMTKIVMDD